MHLIKGSADGDKVRDEFVGVVEVVTKEMGMYFREMSSGFAVMEELEEPPLHHLSAASAHGHSQSVTIRGSGILLVGNSRT